MMLLGVLGALLALILVAVGAARHEEREQRIQRDWLAVAQALRLQASGGASKRSLRGNVRGVPARVDFLRKTQGNDDSRYEVETTTFYAGGDGCHVPASLELRREEPWGIFGRMIDGSDPEIGDQDFDGLVELRGLDVYACAALSEAARQQIKKLTNVGGKVSEGIVVASFEGEDDPSSRWLTEQLELVATIAGLLSVTPDALAQRLAHNAVHDSEPRVRLKNLRFLLAPETQAPATLVAETTRALLADHSAVIRIVAACQLGPAGQPTLLALARSAHNEPPLRAQALMALHEQNAADIDDWAASFLTPSPRELVCAALDVVGSRRLNAHAERVIGLTSAADIPIRVAATRALGRLQSPGAERALLRRLGDDDSDVKAAAAEALGAVGSVAAVEPLLALTKGLGRGELKQVARGAIARIQSRLGDVEAGRVSLAVDDDLAGAVALAQDEEATGGELTLATEPQVFRRSNEGSGDEP